CSPLARHIASFGGDNVVAPTFRFGSFAISGSTSPRQWSRSGDGVLHGHSVLAPFLRRPSRCGQNRRRDTPGGITRRPRFQQRKDPSRPLTLPSSPCHLVAIPQLTGTVRTVILRAPSSARASVGPLGQWTATAPGAARRVIQNTPLEPLLRAAA